MIYADNAATTYGKYNPADDVGAVVTAVCSAYAKIITNNECHK